MIDPKFLGVPPAGLIEDSKDRVVHVIFFGSSHYDEYQMLDGVSHYSGSVSYDRVCLQ
jgi:hypothetical protein